MATKISPETSKVVIANLKKDIVEFLENDMVQKIVEYAPTILSYVENYAKMSETEVDDRAIVIAEAIALLLKGGIPKIIEAWKE